MSDYKSRLIYLRKLNKLTQQDIARYLGITVSAYGYYEQGRNEPSLGTLEKLAKRYSVTISYLLGETNIIDRDYYKINSQDLVFKGLTELEKDYLCEQLKLYRRVIKLRSDKL